MKREQIIEALKGGDVITVTLPKSGTTERTQYTLNGCGKTVQSRQFEALIDDLRPQGDGLFGFSQTYVWNGE